MEMMIVIAIIAILVAIAIPTFTASLDSAKDAADSANLRAATAETVIAWMTTSPGAVITTPTWPLSVDQTLNGGEASWDGTTNTWIIAPQ